MKRKIIGKVFPNLNESLGQYSPTSFYVVLNNMTEKEYKEILRKPFDKKTIEKFSVAVHEFRHHLDNISTLWGQKHILKLFNAVNARIEHNINDFKDIITLKNDEQGFHYDEYYSNELNYFEWKSDKDNWSWSLTSGIKFSTEGIPDESKPIFFITFATPTKIPLVRVPLSIAALLETGAIRDECFIKNRYFEVLPQTEKIKSTIAQNHKLFSEIIYNQDLAVYNSIVHLTANKLNLSDVNKALDISSSLSTLALNLPSEVVKKIPLQLTGKENWDIRAQTLLANNEYSFIFYTLLDNYASLFLADRNTFDIARVLEANKLPTLLELEELVKEEFENIRKSVAIKRNFRNDFSFILEEGLRIFELRKLDGKGVEIIDLLRKHNYQPNIIFTDSRFYNKPVDINPLMDLPLDNFSPEAWYDFSLVIDEKFTEFYNIRGI